VTDHERCFRLSFVVVQPVLYFGFQLLALMMSLLIHPGSISTVKGDLVDRPEENNRQEDQRQSPHDAHLKMDLLMPVRQRRNRL
jgi:hypothetical protein